MNSAARGAQDTIDAADSLLVIPGPRRVRAAMLLWTFAHTAVFTLVLNVPCRAGQADLARADQAWLARADSHSGHLADPARVEVAIDLYRKGCTGGDDGLTPCWKLLRALHYLSEFTDASPSRKDAAVTEAAELANSWIESLDRVAADDSTRARVDFWSAIAWGARAQRVGLLTIVREGIARRMYAYASRAVELDPAVERGGGYRLLSRLHADLPRVPFVSGWVDRDRVLPLAERAFALDRDDIGNLLILAIALEERAPERRAEAISLLEQAASIELRTTLLVEDKIIRAQARKRLASLNPAEDSP